MIIDPTFDFQEVEMDQYGSMTLQGNFVYHITFLKMPYEEGSNHKLKYVDQDWSWNRKGS